MKRGYASFLTLVISSFIFSGILTYFSSEIALQFHNIVKQLSSILENQNLKGGLIYELGRYINVNEAYKYVTNLAQNYLRQFAHSIISLLGYLLNTFSTILLVIIIVFYMLKDGSIFIEKFLAFVPSKYKHISSTALNDSDEILSHYVTGQAKVALSLATMIFIGYKIIDMPNAILFSSITFILAFIPFIGFFISMIIPIVIAISIGFDMLIKLIILFIIIQTLKGRVIVPIIMARALNIHPLTDIFLVIGAVAIGGPIAAFVIVPVYAVIKSIIKKFLIPKDKV
jgi:predicted PurR-regulated permease PerM